MSAKVSSSEILAGDGGEACQEYMRGCEGIKCSVLMLPKRPFLNHILKPRVVKMIKKNVKSRVRKQNSEPHSLTLGLQHENRSRII